MPPLASTTAKLAVLDVLMLRGAQTPGELKARTERLHRFADMEDLGGTLERLIERQLAARLERRPGQREERYTHLLGSEDAPTAEEAPAASSDGVEQRFERLEQQIAELRAELQALRNQRSG